MSHLTKLSIIESRCPDYVTCGYHCIVESTLPKHTSELNIDAASDGHILLLMLKGDHSSTTNVMYCWFSDECYHLGWHQNDEPTTDIFDDNEEGIALLIELVKNCFFGIPHTSRRCIISMAILFNVVPNHIKRAILFQDLPSFIDANDCVKVTFDKLEIFVVKVAQKITIEKRYRYICCAVEETKITCSYFSKIASIKKEIESFIARYGSKIDTIADPKENSINDQKIEPKDPSVERFERFLSMISKDGDQKIYIPIDDFKKLLVSKKFRDVFVIFIDAMTTTNGEYQRVWFKYESQDNDVQLRFVALATGKIRYNFSRKVYIPKSEMKYILDQIIENRLKLKSYHKNQLYSDSEKDVVL